MSSVSSLGAELEALAHTIADRRQSDPETSYTAKLLAGGETYCARKIGEEALELALAIALKDKEQSRAEAADLLYHILVGLVAVGVSPDEVADTLHRRQGRSGLAEKAARGS